MRIACIGNMNNNFFTLVRYLRDAGFETDLLRLDNEIDLFHPSTDTFGTDYEPFTIDLTWGKVFDLRRKTQQEIADQLQRYDFLIGCGSVPAYVEKANRHLDVFVPYGEDIMTYPFFKLVRPPHLLDYFVFTRHQKMGIQNARYINFDYSNDDLEQVFAGLACHGERLVLGIPMIYTPLYNPDTIVNYYDQSQWYQAFAKIRQDHDIVLFHHARQVWTKAKNHFNLKANDKLIRGFAQFVKKATDKQPALVMFERGTDLNETKKLVKALDIEQCVYWFPPMPRKELMVGLSLADIGSGEFHQSWLSCGTIYETLAMAKPLMHYREDHLYQDHYPELYPLINIKNSDDVLQSLLDYVARPDYYKAMGEKGRQWFQRYAVDQPIDEYVKIIKNAS